MLPGVGWSEFLLIAIVAIVVIGPRDLPRVTRSFGRFIGKARAMAREFQDAFEEMAREAEIEEIRKQTEQLRTGAILPDTPMAAAPLTPEQEDSLIGAHNATIMEATSGAPVETAGAVSENPPSESAPPPDNVTPIRGLRR